MPKSASSVTAPQYEFLIFVVWHVGGVGVWLGCLGLI